MELPFGEPAFTVGLDRLVILGASLAISIVLWAVYRYTVFGVLTAALADDRDVLRSLGWASSHLALANWAIGGGIAAASGILLSTLVPLSATFFTAVTVTALAAGVLGGFQRFWPVYLAAIAIGLAQPLLSRYSDDLRSATSLGGWSESLPFFVIIVVLLVRGRSIPGRGRAWGCGSPGSRFPASALVSSSPVDRSSWCRCWPPSRGSRPSSRACWRSSSACRSSSWSGWPARSPWRRWPSPGSGRSPRRGRRASSGCRSPLPVAIGVVTSALLGAVIGVPALRIRQLDLAVVTLGGALALDRMIFSDRSLTGADVGRQVESPTLGPIDLNPITQLRSFAVLVAVAGVASAIAVAWFACSRVGRTAVAQRSDERAAVASGVWLTETKLLTFSFGAAIAGLAGSLTAYRTLRVSPSTFSVFASIEFVTVAVLGGIGSVYGAAVAALLVPSGILSHLIGSGGSSWQTVALGAVVLVIVRCVPDGLVFIGRSRRRAGASLVGQDHPRAGEPEPAAHERVEPTGQLERVGEATA